MSRPEALPTLQHPDGSTMRVLVVDDEGSLRELLTMALRLEAWDVRSAEDGLQAVRLAREFRPDAVVLDMMLPTSTAWRYCGDCATTPPASRCCS